MGLFNIFSKRVVNLIKQRNRFGITGFVLSLVSILFVTVSYLNILIPIVALVFSILQFRVGKSGLAIAGIIIASIFLLVGIVQISNLSNKQIQVDNQNVNNIDNMIEELEMTNKNIDNQIINNTSENLNLDRNSYDLLINDDDLSTKWVYGIGNYESDLNLINDNYSKRFKTFDGLLNLSKKSAKIYGAVIVHSIYQFKTPDYAELRYNELIEKTKSIRGYEEYESDVGNKSFYVTYVLSNADRTVLFLLNKNYIHIFDLIETYTFADLDLTDVAKKILLK